MDIIIGKRGYGKTTKLIRRSSDENLYILVATRQRAYQVAQMATEMGLTIPFPVTVDEYLRSNKKFRGSSIRRDGLLIDDADDVLQVIFAGIPIKEITITDHNEVGNCIRYLPKLEEEEQHQVIYDPERAIEGVFCPKCDRWIDDYYGLPENCPKCGVKLTYK